jgi:hypothetical protein
VVWNASLERNNNAQVENMYKRLKRRGGLFTLAIIYTEIVQWSVLWQEFIHNINQGEFNEAKTPSLPDMVQLAVTMQRQHSYKSER